MNAKVLEVIRRAQSFTVRSADGQIEEVIPTWTEERLCAEIESIIAAALAEKEAEIARLREVLKAQAELPAEMLAMFEREGYIFDNITGKWEKLAFSLYCEIVNSGHEAAALLPPDEKKEEHDEKTT